jgi:hypothetical protein
MNTSVALGSTSLRSHGAQGARPGPPLNQELIRLRACMLATPQAAHARRGLIQGNLSLFKFSHHDAELGVTLAGASPGPLFSSRPKPGFPASSRWLFAHSRSVPILIQGCCHVPDCLRIRSGLMLVSQGCASSPKLAALKKDGACSPQGLSSADNGGTASQAYLLSE